MPQTKLLHHNYELHSSLRHQQIIIVVAKKKKSLQEPYRRTSPHPKKASKRRCKMSERKVLSKYYPPDFDPSSLSRRRGPKPTGPKIQTVRVAAPFSMRCTSCGEYVYKGRKFNARKETPPGVKYLNIQIFRFYIRCTRCSAEICYRTDPKNNDYAMERGAKRNTEPWRQKELAEETDEQRLDRLEREMQDEPEESNAMADLEAKTAEAQREMAVADALDEIRARTALREKAAKDQVFINANPEANLEEEERRQDEEDMEYARKVMAAARFKNLPEPGPEPEPQPTAGQKRKLHVPMMPALKLLRKEGGSTPPLGAKKAAVLVDYASDSDDG